MIQKFRKTALTDAVEITVENFELLKEMGASILQYNERSLDAWHEYGKVGEAVIWTFGDPKRELQNSKIQFAQCKTIEGLHTAELPSMLMRGQSGELYFCTKEIFEKTYEPV